MLAYFLAAIVGIGSVVLYLAAFLLPEIHRQKDIFWSGLGLFYALVLWVNAQGLSGGLLLGQTLSVILLGWFTWETLSLRREITPANQRTPLPSTPDLNWSALSGGQPSDADNVDESFTEDPAILGARDQPESRNIDAQPWIEIRQEFPQVPTPPQPPSE